MGKLKMGLDFQTRALDLRKELLGERHPYTAFSLNDVGGCYLDMGDVEKGLNFATRALELCKELLGERHPDVANSLNNVGICHEAMGDFKKGMELQARALKLNREVLGDGHPSVALGYRNVGLCHFKSGDYGRALALFESGRKIFKDLNGSDHQNTVDAAIYSLMSLQKLGMAEKIFTLAKEMVHANRPGTWRYQELIDIYNDARPLGTRGLSPEGPKKWQDSKSSGKGKKGRK